MCIASESKAASQAGTILIPNVIPQVDHQMLGLTEALSTDSAIISKDKIHRPRARRQCVLSSALLTVSNK